MTITSRITVRTSRKSIIYIGPSHPAPPPTIEVSLSHAANTSDHYCGPADRSPALANPAAGRTIEGRAEGTTAAYASPEQAEDAGWAAGRTCGAEDWWSWRCSPVDVWQRLTGADGAYAVAYRDGRGKMQVRHGSRQRGRPVGGAQPVDRAMALFDGPTDAAANCTPRPAAADSSSGSPCRPQRRRGRPQRGRSRRRRRADPDGSMDGCPTRTLPDHGGRWTVRVPGTRRRVRDPAQRGRHPSTPTRRGPARSM